jgi:CopG family transcriptional regulator / antitoxin EndoAI
MTKRINIVLPETTVHTIDRLTTTGGRSRFINYAVMHYVQTRSKENLRERLKQEALANAQRDVDMAEEWFPLEEEAWQHTKPEVKHG